MKVPVIEIRVTAQELGMVLLDLKCDLGQECPVIGVIAASNMLCETDRLRELLGVEVKRYLAYDSQELSGTVSDAMNDGCAGVVGGETVCNTASALGVPHMFLKMGGESLRMALDIASRVGYAIDLEKRDRVEMDTMLSSIPYGIMQTSRTGAVTRINRFVCSLLGRDMLDIVEHSVYELLPELDRKLMEATLDHGEEAYVIAISVREISVLVNIVPIYVGSDITGALLTFQEGKKIIEMDSKLRLELNQRGFVATHTFEGMHTASPVMQKCVATARRAANCEAPILLMGERSVGKRNLAECIHNLSFRKNGAFVSLDCSAWQAENLDNMLFGNYTTRKDSEACLAELAGGGTLYLSRVEELPMELQFKVLNLARGKFLHNGTNLPRDINIRVIASTEVNLVSRVEQKEFRSDLYYALSVFCIEVPALRERREDIMSFFDRYLLRWQSKHKRNMSLTDGAKKYVESFDWPGNLEQMENLCERTVLLSDKRSVDEAFLRRELEMASPKLITGTEKVVMFKDEKAAHIAELLKKHNGNREKVAAELGISKTTLWRYIKKYGIEQDYSF